MSQIDDQVLSLTETSQTDFRRKAAGHRYLFNVWMDFLLLGGGGLVMLAIIILIFPLSEKTAALAAISGYIAHVVNHPHFAHSYQIFYRNFARVMQQGAYSPALQMRYMVAGVIVPLAHLVLFLYCFITSDLRTLGVMTNVMFLLVGWHYTKQGYGIAIVDSVLKKAFYTDQEKKILLLCSYAGWFSTWLNLNVRLSHSSFKLYGLEYFILPIPQMFYYPSLSAILFCFCVTVYIFGQKILRDRKNAPYNGMLAYLVSLYLWVTLARIHPVYALFVPALHSLQYMAVVWRFQMNKSASEKARSAVWGVARFTVIGIALGYIGFNGLPMLMDWAVQKPALMQNVSVFFLMSALLINNHHYFMDNVIWRKDNPDVSEHLFKPPR